jgi:hypothetical protein
MVPKKFVATLFGVALIGYATSCSLALTFDEHQCEKDDDCKTRGFQNAVCSQNVCVAEASGSGTGSNMSSTSSGMVVPGFECLGTFKNPDPMGMAVNQQFYFENAGSITPISMGEIKANLCSPLTADCLSPKQSNLVPDMEGHITVPVDQLPGYLEVKDAHPMNGAGGATGGDPMQDFRPVLVYENRPIKLPDAPPFDLVTKNIRVITYADFVTLSQIVQATEEPTMHGIVLAVTVDCNDQRAAGVQVSIDPSDKDDTTVAAYFKGQLPKLGQTETDSEGAFAMVNVPVNPNGSPKAVTLSTTLAATGQQIGSGTVFIRPGWITYVHIGPTEGGM